MKTIKRVFLSCSLVVTLLFVFASHVHAQSNNTHALSIVEGSVVVTPAWCRVNPCLSTVATLTGNLSAQIPTLGDQILFPSSSLTTKPDVGFQLPNDPREDLHGEVRDITWGFDGETLKAEGYVDSRAFDGPLVQYKFVAKVTRAQAFTARPDYRRCAAPLCGGYFVKLVNHKRTQCADGSLKEECYVASIVYRNDEVQGDTEVLQNGVTSVANRTPLLIVGALESRASIPFDNLGVLVAQEAYRSATQNTAVGRFYGVTNNGIMCITTPCFSYDEMLLNKPARIAKLSEINLEMSGASPDDIAQAQQLLADGGVLYASGRNQRYEGFAGTGVRLVAQQFYLPLKPVETVKPQ